MTETMLITSTNLDVIPTSLSLYLYSVYITHILVELCGTAPSSSEVICVKSALGPQRIRRDSHRLISWDQKISHRNLIA